MEEVQGRRVKLGWKVWPQGMRLIAEELRKVKKGVEGAISIQGLTMETGSMGRKAIQERRFLEAKFEKGARLSRQGAVERWMQPGEVASIGRRAATMPLRGTRLAIGALARVL